LTLFPFITKFDVDLENRILVTVNILHLSEGHSNEKKTVTPAELGFAKNDAISKPIDVLFDIDKVGSEFYVKTSLNTVAHFTCDRCAVGFDANIDESVRIILTTDKNLLGQDDVYKVNEGTSEVDVSESLYQSLTLAFPVKKLCSDMCKGLCSFCGANLNKKMCSCKSEEIDPRWEGLKKLLDN
jgi:uncharacterized protein